MPKFGHQMSLRFVSKIVLQLPPMRESFPTDEIYKQFNDLSQLLEAWRFNFQHFPTSTQKGTVQLDEFAAWCADVGQSIPPELAALAKVDAEVAPAAKVEVVPDTTPASATTTNKIRRDILDPAIDKAIEQAGSMVLANVYLKLKELALASEPPFTGRINGNALCYTDTNDKPATLSKDALGQRLKRRTKKAATN